MKSLRRVVASAITPEVFQVLQQSHQVTMPLKFETANFDVQAGLEDFGYMENVTSVAQLKEQIVVTGAEVREFTFLKI